MTKTLSARCLHRLEGVHPALVAVIKRAAELYPRRFIVLEGLRTLERQVRLVERGASRTTHSRHLTGHAVDIAPLDDDGGPSWHWPDYHEMQQYVKQAASELRTPIEWGGDWRTFPDGPHWQLPRAEFPAKKASNGEG